MVKDSARRLEGGESVCVTRLGSKFWIERRGADIGWIAQLNYAAEIEDVSRVILCNGGIKVRHGARLKGDG